MSNKNSATALADKISQLALDKKGNDVFILDLRGISDITDYFVIVSGQSDNQVKTLANHIEKSLREEKISAYHKEGFSKLRWVLIDYVDVVVHIFREETRAYYALERLWADAKVIKVEENAGTRSLSEASN